MIRIILEIDSDHFGAEVDLTPMRRPCHYCNATGLYWGHLETERGGQWRLFEEDGSYHKCYSYTEQQVKGLRRVTMGIYKRRARVYYRTDAGKTVAVDEMSVSHLMNAINHHLKQVDLLQGIMEGWSGDLSFIEQRHKDLVATVDTLIEELNERDPKKDAEAMARPDDGGDWPEYHVATLNYPFVD